MLMTVIVEKLTSQVKDHDPTTSVAYISDVAEVSCYGAKVSPLTQSAKYPLTQAAVFYASADTESILVWRS